MRNSASLAVAVLLLANANAFSAVKSIRANSLDKFVIGTAALSKIEDPEEYLDAALERGFNTYDLARTYGNGESEKIFGRWLARHGGDAGVRQNLKIITKGGMGDDKYGDPNRPILTFESLRKEVTISLQQLQTETIDLYMLHRDDPRVDVGTIVEWMNVFIDEGIIKSWGCSNWPLARTKDAIEFARENDYAPPKTNSPQFSLAVPDGPVWPTTVSLSGPDELETIEWYRQNDVDLYVWEVLAKGFMAKPDLWDESQVDRASLSRPVIIGSDEWRLQRIQKAYCTDDNYMRRKLALELADNHGLTLAQISTLYALGTGDHMKVIIGSSKAKHLDELMELQHVRLDDVAMNRLTLANDQVGAREPVLLGDRFR